MSARTHAEEVALASQDGDEDLGVGVDLLQTIEWVSLEVGRREQTVGTHLEEGRQPLVCAQRGGRGQPSSLALDRDADAHRVVSSAFFFLGWFCDRAMRCSVSSAARVRLGGGQRGGEEDGARA